MIILDGKKLALAQSKKLHSRVAKLKQHGQTPGLAVVMVGQHPASAVYVQNKQKFCQELGINFYLVEFPATATSADICNKIHLLNQDKKIHGIILQLPLPDKLSDPTGLLSEIDPRKDVDGLHPLNLGLLALGQEIFVPATPKGVLALLREYKIPLAGRKVVVVGFGPIAGMPLSLLLARAKSTVTIAQDKTKDLSIWLKSADIVISAAGQPGLIKGNMIKSGAVVVDVGITKRGKQWLGDVDFATVSKRAGYLTPVPGGVGPLTVSALIDNVVTAAEYWGRGA
ncbi:MAG: bifunctional 5,10-methylenetetrahydrofolate dehydrogenase/5,10-methenyltetrahydrofolate cyclohydrolase [Patescibacteria group bacterium]